MNIVTKKIELSDGRVIEIETGKIAKQADGSAVVKMGGTMLLATVTCAKEAAEDTDFLPLQVDYKEKFYSAGRFPGGFMKREGLCSRMISTLQYSSTSGASRPKRTSSRMLSQDLLHLQLSLAATFRSSVLSPRYASPGSTDSSRSILRSPRPKRPTSN